MDALLLTEAPPLPPGAGTMQAITMSRNYGYNDTATFVPLTIRNRVPVQMKKEGRLRLYLNDQGFMYDRMKDPSGTSEWGKAFFVIQGQLVHVFLPLNHVRVGADFRPLSAKLADEFPLLDVATPLVQPQPGQDKLTRFIRTTWTIASQKCGDFRRLNMSNEDFNSIFGAGKLANSIGTIMDGMIPQVRQLLSGGNFTIQGLINIPKITSDWPGNYPAVYLRVYTHRDEQHVDVEDAALYIGQSIRPFVRMMQHENEINGASTGPHYTIARKSSSEHRHSIPLLSFKGVDISPTVLNLAEQTMVLVFNSYHPWLRKVAVSEAAARMVSQASFLNSIARNAQQAVAWPVSRYIGCNSVSPVFEFSQHRQIICIPMQTRNPEIRTFTTYRTPTRLSILPHTNFGPLIHFTYFQDGQLQRTSFKMPNEVINKYGFSSKSHGYLVIEIMDDGKRHDRPWIGVPSVGPFENFERASSVSVRFEFLFEAQNIWLSLPIERVRIHDNVLQTVERNDVEMALTPYRRAMDLIQVLERLTYTAPLNGFPAQLDLGKIRIMQVKTDHLKQELHLVPKRGKVCPAPPRATWEYNRRLMRQQFDTPLTHVGPSEPPRLTDDVMVFQEGEARSGGMIRGSGFRCDFCKYSSYNNRNPPCELVENHPHGKVCKLCALFNRPCSFTSLSHSTQLWGNQPPFLIMNQYERQFNLSRFPTGPHAWLAYHHTLRPEQLCQASTIRVPFGGSQGLVSAVVEEEDDEAGGAVDEN